MRRPAVRSKFRLVLAALAVSAGMTAGMTMTVAPASHADVQPYIVGGDTVTTPRPYISALHYGTTSRHGGFTCTSALVAPQWVLTAAHCVDSNSRYYVRIGSLNRSSGGTVANVTAKYLAPDYNWPEGDIALLKIDRSVSGAIPMATAADLRSGQGVRLFGWGSQNPDWSGPLPEKLQTTAGTTFDCTAASRVVCTDTTGSIAGGDSGGPAIVHSASTGRVVHLGVAAIGHKPAGSGWAAYTSTAEYRSWIRQVAGI